MPSPSTIIDPSEPVAVGRDVAAALAAREERAFRRSRGIIGARQILLLYGAVYYLIPAVLTAVFGAPLDQILISSPNYIAGAIFCAFVIGAVYLAIGRIRLPRPLFLRNLSGILFSQVSVMGAGILFLLLSFYFWRQFGLSYRQTGSRIEDSGSAVILFYVIQNYILTVLVIYIGFDRERLREHYLLATGTMICIVAGTLLSIQAASNVVALTAALVITVRLWIKDDFLRAKQSSRAGKFATVILMGVATLGALFVGIANKRGVDQTLFMFVNNIGEIVRVFQTRISYNFYSASFHTTFNFTNMQLPWQAVDEVWTNIQHRIDVLLGRPTTFNEITSVKRLNFEMIAYYFRARTGTAPGLVGAIFFYPLGIFLLPLITAFYAAVFKVLSEVVGTQRVSLLELAFLALFAGGILDASIDLFNPFDTPFTKFFFLLCAYSLTGRTAGERLAEEQTLDSYSRIADERALARQFAA